MGWYDEIEYSVPSVLHVQREIWMDGKYGAQLVLEGKDQDGRNATVFLGAGLSWEARQGGRAVVYVDRDGEERPEIQRFSRYDKLYYFLQGLKRAGMVERLQEMGREPSPLPFLEGLAIRLEQREREYRNQNGEQRTTTVIVPTGWADDFAVEVPSASVTSPAAPAPPAPPAPPAASVPEFPKEIEAGLMSLAKQAKDLEEYYRLLQDPQKNTVLEAILAANRWADATRPATYEALRRA